jgi:hypothetical protein
MFWRAWLRVVEELDVVYFGSGFDANGSTVVALGEASYSGS